MFLVDISTMKKHFHILYITAITCVLALSACGSAKLSVADEQMERGEYFDAAATYRKIYNKLTKREDRPTRGVISYKMGECYRKTNMTARATAAYQNAIRYEYPDSMAYLHLAQSQHKEGKYAAAIKSYEKFLEIVPNSPEARDGKRGCQLALKWKATPTRYIVKNAKLFNSRRADFAPMYLGKDLTQLYFTSSNDKASGDRKSEITGMKNCDVFVAKKDEIGVWLRPEHVEGELNSEFDEGITAFSPDGKTIAYTCRKKVGKEYSLSTNSDIYLYNVADKSVQNISEGIMGYDQNPVFSNNGKYIVWESMEHDGYESDKQRIMLYNLETAERTDLTAKLDQTCYSYAWSDDDSKIFFISPFRGTREIFVYNFADNSFKQVTKDVHDINAFELKDGKIYTQEVSMSHPAEVFVYDANAEMAQGQQISAINTEVLDKVNMGKVEERWIKTTNGEDMLVWVVYPYNYDSTQTYPALLFCQGGPQDMVSQFWSTRWNFQLMSGAGYFVIAPNRHGVPGFGTKWNEQISCDYGGQNMKDYMQAYDVIAKQHPNIDENRVGACGASYGAFSVYWLAGNHQNRFKAFLAHNGMFNLEQQYCETEEMWFVNWDLGGPYWDKNNATAQRSYANSPHKFIQNWNTPICVIHGELDYRIVASQGMAAYNAAVLRGVPARYLYFPDENHWVLQPQNSVLWHRNFIDWFDKWLKK